MKTKKFFNQLNLIANQLKFYMKFIHLLCLLVCCSCFLQAQTKNQSQSKIEFTEFTLDNGLEVVLHQDRSTPIVAISVLYHVGSKNEKPDRTGFAHFFEHLLFEGSENIGRGEYSKYVENAGGSLNAFTNYDQTYYFEELPSNQLELVLWLESERMLHAKVENEGIETQREVVKEERRQRIENAPYGGLVSETMKRVYKKHPYKWPVIGYMEHLNAAEEKDYVDFYKTFYVPNNAVLAIAGDIDIEDTKKMVKKYFNGIPKGKGEIPRTSVVEPKQTTEIVDTAYDNIQLPAIVMAYRVPESGTDEYYACDMLSMLLSQGQSSRLYRTMVDEKQLAIQAGAFPFGLEDPGVTLAYCITNAGVEAKDAVETMTEEFAKVRNELISEKEYQKLRNQIENDMVRNYASLGGISQSLAEYKTYQQDANLINTEIKKYLAVTKEDIQSVAKKYFTDNNRVVLYYLPKPPEAPAEDGNEGDDK